MSTNSVVGYLRSDGSIVSSYVPYDGYETGVGMTLLEHYNSDERALAVSVGGYYSSLSEDLRESLESSVHTEEVEMFDSMTEFEEYLMENSHLEFGYLWTGGKWMVHLGLQPLRDLEEMLNTNQLGMDFLGWLLHLFVQDVRQYNDLGILHLRITEIPLNTMSMQMSWKLSLKSGIGMVWVK